MREVACPVCGTWNIASNKTCNNCGSVLDRNEIRRREKEEEKNKIKIEVNRNPAWLDKLITRAQESKNPFVRYTIKTIVFLWMIYMAAVGAVLWAVAWLAG